MNRYKMWASREYSRRQRLVAVILGGVAFWFAIPLFIIVGSNCLDAWFSLPRFSYGRLNHGMGSVLIIAGWLFANWTVKVQYSMGRGTPIPLMATQKLLVKGPYQYCRNPMTLGTAAFYLGIAIWTGSLSAL